MENKKKWRRIKATTFIPIFWNWEKLFSIILFQSFGIGGNYLYRFYSNLLELEKIIFIDFIPIFWNWRKLFFIIFSQSLANFRLFPPINRQIIAIIF